MRKLIAIILVLIGFVSQAQTYLVQPAKWRFTNSQRFDSTVRFYNLPLFTGDTIIGFNPLTGKLGRKILTSSIPVWGTITGTLSNQTDLQNALNAKQATLTLTTTGTSGAATLTGATLNIPQYSGTTYTGGNGIIVSGSTIYNDSTKFLSLHGFNGANGTFIGTNANRSMKFYANSLLRGQLDSNGRWAFGTMKPIAPIHIGVAGSGRQKFMFVAEPGFLSTYGFNFYTDANTGGFYIHGFNNSVEASSPAFTIERNGNRVGFNTGSGIAIASSAIVEIVSTTGGFLPPRMTTTQRTSISSPAEGLTVYDLTLHKLYVYDGTTWQAVW